MLYTVLSCTWAAVLGVLLLPDVPTNCTALPTASLQNGSWPLSCAQAAFGATCSASCTFGGSASVECFLNGTWSSTASAACNGEAALLYDS